MFRIKSVVVKQVFMTLLGAGMVVSPLSVLEASAAQGKEIAASVAKPSAAAVSATAQEELVFATVNGKAITIREFKGLLAETMRGRYYHGTPPEGEAEKLNKEVGELVIDRELLSAEAERRGIRPDSSKFSRVLADLDTRYANQPEWVSERDQFVPLIKINIDRQSMVDQLEQVIREVPQPSSDEVRFFYDKNADLFTEPERISLSIILLKVDPSSTRQEWDRAREEAKKITKRIRNGADFAEQARVHSQHDSAANGGSMGYLHGGMMPGGLEENLGQLKVGIASDPITSLEGIVVARIDERIPPKLRDFLAVQERAQDLLLRSLADDAWKKTISQLRAGATIKILTPQLSGER